MFDLLRNRRAVRKVLTIELFVGFALLLTTKNKSIHKTLAKFFQKE